MSTGFRHNEIDTQGTPFVDIEVFRKFRILTMRAEGYTSQQIASAVSIKLERVEAYLEYMDKRLQAICVSQNRTRAVSP